MEVCQPTLRPRNEGEAIRVAETVLRRRRAPIPRAARKAKRDLLQKPRTARAALKAISITSPEKLTAHSRIRRLDTWRFLRVRKRSAAPRVRYAETVAVLFVVRNARKPVSRSSHTILSTLGITQPYTATIVRNSAQSMQMLRSAEPFVFYGCLNNDTMRSLFFKRLRLKHSNADEATDQEEGPSSSDIPASDNVVIEERLGHIGMLCVEDLVLEVLKGGDHFEDIMKHLSAFRLGDITKAEGLKADPRRSGFIGFDLNQKLVSIL